MGLLKVENLLKTYKNKKHEITALNNVTYEFPSKGLVLVVGESGSGKTTLLNMLSGNDKPDSGEIYIGDVKLTNDKEFISSYKLEVLSYMFQEHNLIEDMTVYQNIEFALTLQGKEVDYELLLTMLASVDLSEEYLSKYPDELSGGEFQRIVIVRSLLRNSQILIADEPTSSLDPTTKKEIYEIFKHVSNDKLVIISSHDYDGIKDYADVILRMEKGILTEEKNAVKKQENAKKIDIVNCHNGLNKRYLWKNAKKTVFTKPVRYITNILILMLSITLFSTLVSAMTINAYSAVEKLVAGGELKEVVAKAPYNNGSTNINEMQFDKIAADVPEANFIPVYKAPDVDRHFGDDYQGDQINYFKLYDFNGLIKLDTNNNQNLGIKKLLAGEYPKPRTDGKYEVLLTEYLFESYELHGYLEEDGTTTTIKNYDDILNKVITCENKDEFVIKGIIDIDSNREIFAYAKEETVHRTDRALRDFLDYARDGSIYIDASYEEETVIRFYTMNHNLSKNTLKKVLELGDSESGIYTFSTREIAEIYSQVAMNKEYFGIYISILVAFTIFTVFLLVSKIKFSLILNSKDYGIINSLGAKDTYFYWMYAIAGAISVVIAYGGSLILSKFTIQFANGLYNQFMVIHIDLYVQNVLAIILSLVWAGILIFLTYMIPVNRKLKQNTIMMINRKE